MWRKSMFAAFAMLSAMVCDDVKASHDQGEP
jgi:hypothetical protein